MGIADDWYQFREKALEQIVIDWLEENEIPYLRDSSDGTVSPSPQSPNPPETIKLPTVQAAGPSINKAAELLRILVEEAGPALEKISESASAIRPGERKWSKKEIIGHLVDSAANNHQRFVRAQLEPELRLPSYDQEQWVRSQAYQQMKWGQLVAFWRRYNLLLAHVVDWIPKTSLNTQCWIGSAQPVPLIDLVKDYLRHLMHHLRQVLPELPILQLPIEL